MGGSEMMHSPLHPCFGRHGYGRWVTGIFFMNSFFSINFDGSALTPLFLKRAK
jgi:hypothetical protein